MGRGGGCRKENFFFCGVRWEEGRRTGLGFVRKREFYYYYFFEVVFKRNVQFRE